jgi:hypothetical protein
VTAAELIIAPDRGRLVEGYLADIVGVPGNPLDDITVTQNVQFVMKGGKVLAGSVFTSDTDRGLAIAARIRTGSFGINQGYIMDPFAPFGGVKSSGYGRELGWGVLTAISTRSRSRLPDRATRIGSSLPLLSRSQELAGLTTGSDLR